MKLYGENISFSGTTHNSPALVHVTNKSETDGSNVKSWNWDARYPVGKFHNIEIAARYADILPLDTFTPLGVPVDPDVNSM